MIKWKELLSFSKSYQKFIYYLCVYFLLTKSNSIRSWLFKFREKDENKIWKDLKKILNIDFRNKYILFFVYFFSRERTLVNTWKIFDSLFIFHRFAETLPKHSWILIDWRQMNKNRSLFKNNEIPVWIKLYDCNSGDEVILSDIYYFLNYSIYKELKNWNLLKLITQIVRKNWKKIKFIFSNWYRKYNIWYFQYINSLLKNKDTLNQKQISEKSMISYYFETYLYLHEEINKFDNEQEFFDICKEFYEVTIFFLDIFKHNCEKYWIDFSKDQKFKNTIIQWLNFFLNKKTWLNQVQIKEIKKYIKYFN